MEPQDILSIIDFAYNKIGGKLLIVLADCIGYYSNKDIKVNENFLNDNWSWTGCGAGKHVIGILHNGDIVACTSIRDKTLVAGNIREKSLKSIWESPDSFKWNRNFDSSKLKGFCRECRYTERCLGGCSNSRYCINGSFESENRYCAYNVEMKKWKFCSSLSFILTGLILTIVLCHKQDHSYMIIFPQLLIFSGIALHLKIAHQDYESAFKEIIRFLVYSAVFLIAILLSIKIYISKMTFGLLFSIPFFLE